MDAVEASTWLAPVWHGVWWEAALTLMLLLFDGMGYCLVGAASASMVRAGSTST
jgi:hypothetical protein